MTDRPILFSAPMIRALLAGTKTQTRRVIKPQPVEWKAQVIDITKPIYDEDEGSWGQWLTEWSVPSFDMPMGQPEREIWCPLRGLRYAVGDRLWVRETWAISTIYDGVAPRDLNPERVPNWCGIRFAATDERLGIKDRPSIFMPRWASRLTLYVTDVRVQRLQDISEEDARAEGAYVAKASRRVADDYATMALAGAWFHTARAWYADLWDSINGPGSWAANPWVAAYTFAVRAGNIDTLPATLEPAGGSDA